MRPTEDAIKIVDDNISGFLKDLRLELAKLAKQAEDVDEKFEIMRFIDRCVSLTEDLECFLMQKKRDYVYWVEVSGAKQGVFLRYLALNKVFF